MTEHDFTLRVECESAMAEGMLSSAAARGVKDILDGMADDVQVSLAREGDPRDN